MGGASSSIRIIDLQDTWNRPMEQALAGHNCQVSQSTSDEALGLLAYVEPHLGAPHAPDLFDMQPELVKAVPGSPVTKQLAAGRPQPRRHITPCGRTMLLERRTPWSRCCIRDTQVWASRLDIPPCAPQLFRTSITPPCSEIGCKGAGILPLILLAVLDCIVSW